jgi:hypothetical protein
MNTILKDEICIDFRAPFACRGAPGGRARRVVLLAPKSLDQRSRYETVRQLRDADETRGYIKQTLVGPVYGLCWIEIADGAGGKGARIPMTEETWASLYRASPYATKYLIDAYADLIGVPL